MKLIEVILTATSLEEMRRFYIGVLGLRELEPAWTERLAIEAGETRLVFTPGPPGWQGRYHFAFDVPPGRYEQALRWLSERGGPISDRQGRTQFHSDNWNADSVYFTDPQGNILELIARHTAPASIEARTSGDDERRRLADRPFNASEIVAVTEIGLAVGSVADAVAQITERMPGAGIYQEGSDTFTPVGDEEGLLIVVLRGRIWFPETGVPANPLPLDVLVEVRGEGGLRRRYRLDNPPEPFAITPAS